MPATDQSAEPAQTEPANRRLERARRPLPGAVMSAAGGVGLSPNAVRRLMRECMSIGAGEQPKAVDGVVVRNVQFSPSKLAEHCVEIAALLAELPDQFRVDAGGGWSFLNACEDRHGNLWTGEHSMVEQLFLLGLASGLATELLPREMWGALPGGVPYYSVDLSAALSRAASGDAT